MRSHISITLKILTLASITLTTSFSPVMASPRPNTQTAKFGLHSVLSPQGLTCKAMLNQSGVKFQFASDMNSADVTLPDGQSFSGYR